MSAWLVSNETLSNLAATIDSLTHGNDGKKIVRGWAKMNREALIQRYGDDNPAARIGNGKVLSQIQFIKSLQCLRYQCSEGNVGEKTYVEEMKLLNEYIKRSMDSYISNTEEYRKAVWG